jgi:hypothetical protein
MFSQLTNIAKLLLVNPVVMRLVEFSLIAVFRFFRLHFLLPCLLRRIFPLFELLHGVFLIARSRDGQ